MTQLLLGMFRLFLELLIRGFEQEVASTPFEETKIVAAPSLWPSSPLLF